MTTALVLVEHLEAEMAKAQEAGDEVAFVAARNKRQAYWDYRDGVIDLAQAQARMTKVPQQSRRQASTECVSWQGDIEKQ